MMKDESRRGAYIKPLDKSKRSSTEWNQNSAQVNRDLSKPYPMDHPGGSGKKLPKNEKYSK